VSAGGQEEQPWEVKSSTTTGGAALSASTGFALMTAAAISMQAKAAVRMIIMGA
jgi:hypothetical protein